MSKSISEIKIEFEQAGEQQWEALCQEYETDSRTGVKSDSKISEEAAGTCSGERTPRGNENIREKICGL